jgi:hypothetical protein
MVSLTAQQGGRIVGLVTCFAPRRYGRLVENQRSWRRPLWDGATNALSALHLPFGISVAYQFF